MIACWPRWIVTWLGPLGLSLLLLMPASAQTSLVEGVRKYEAGDYEGAIAEWRPLAERGNRAALFNLGQVYRLGRGVEIDLDRAMDYYRQAAERGFTDAQQILATLMFYAEDATEADKSAALQWWRTAARLGNARAQYHLGVLNWNGEMVDQDLIRAYAWMVLAAGQDLKQAEEAEITMRRHLSVKEMADGRLLAKDLVDREAIAEHRTAGGAEAGRHAVARDDDASEPARARDRQAESSRASGTPAPAADKPAEVPASPATDVSTDNTSTSKDRAQATGAPPSGPPPANADTGVETGLTWESGWRLQLVSMRNRNGVEAAWQGLADRAPDLVGELDHRIERVDLGARGVFHRLKIGPFPSREAARRRCDALQAAGQDCFLLAPAS